MIYRRLTLTDQSYEVSCHDKNFVLCSMRYGVIEKINLVEKSASKMFAAAGYHAVVCDVFTVSVSYNCNICGICRTCHTRLHICSRQLCITAPNSVSLGC